MDLDADDENDFEELGTRVVRKWSKEEERLLAEIWVEVSQNKDIGNDRSKEHF